MRVTSAVLAVAAIMVGLLAFPSTGAAQSVQEFPVLNATAPVFSGGGLEAYVVSRGPPPKLFIFRRRRGVEGWDKTGEAFFPDPDSVIVDVFVRFDGLVVVVARNGVTVFDPADAQYVSFHGFPPEVERATGAGAGFNTDMLTDFLGDTGPGALRYGSGFGSQLVLPDTDKPNAVDLLPDVGKSGFEPLSSPRSSAEALGAARRARIRSLFVVIDANNNRLLEVSDSARPSLLGSRPGPPAASGTFPPRDVAVSPLNYNRSFYGVGSHPILVPVPAVGNVFVLRKGVWKPLSSTPFGRPQGVDASCNSVAVTDFHNSKVTFFNFKQPKAAVCEDLVSVAFAGGRVSSPKVLVKPYGTFRATVSLSFNLAASSRAAASRKVKTKARKARLRAGRIKTVRLKFSRRASAAIGRALQRRRSLKGTLTLRLKNKAGGRFTVKRPLRVRRG